jgi:peptidyl-prolyl cis-trans isomerase D
MRKLRSSSWKLLPLVIPLFFIGCGGGEKEPPGPNIVATYADGEISVEDLQNYIEERTVGLEIMVGDSLVPLKNQMPKEMKVYRALIQDMVLDGMVRRKIKEKQLDNRSNIRHALKHIEDELTLQQLDTEIHEKDRIPIDETEIQRYYDKNRSLFGEKPLYQVRDEIKSILESQKEEDYLESYIGELKDAATITKDFEILRIPEPTEGEVREAYEINKANYKEPEKWVIDQIVIAGSRAKAQKAWAKLGAGLDFQAVAREFGRDGTFNTINYTLGSRSEAFEKAATSLNPGEFSKPIQEGEEYLIVRLKENITASYKPFRTVRAEARRSLLKNRQEKLYEENKNRTLFTLHGRRYTLGDFYEEFKELPPAEQEKNSTYDKRLKMVDRMIQRLLLLEDSYDRMLNAKKKETIEHIRQDVLKEAMHREEVDQKLEVSDEQIREFYEANKRRLKTPERVKISVIVVRRGRGQEEDNRAREKIQEAYKKLNPGWLKKGMPFEEVARRYSEDSQTAQNGGRVDHWISETGDLLREMLDHPWHERIMHLKEGAITKPFPGGDSYFIVQIREKDKPRQLSFEEAKEDLKPTLKLIKHNELTVEIYTAMIDRANLVIYDQVLTSLIDKQKEVGGLQ